MPGGMAGGAAQAAPLAGRAHLQAGRKDNGADKRRAVEGRETERLVMQVA